MHSHDLLKTLPTFLSRYVSKGIFWRYMFNMFYFVVLNMVKQQCEQHEAADTKNGSSVVHSY